MIAHINIKDILGQRFGKLVAVEFVGTKGRKAVWKFKCDCGNEKEIVSRNAVSGQTMSCGCLLSDDIRRYHGKKRERTPEYIQQVIFRQRKYRNDFLKMYGEKCRCCGESSKEFLTIEHINGQKGKKDHSTTAYRKAVLEYRSDIYEILCMNCNHAKGRYGYCPHSS